MTEQRTIMKSFRMTQAECDLLDALAGTERTNTDTVVAGLLALQRQEAGRPLEITIDDVIKFIRDLHDV